MVRDMGGSDAEKAAMSSTAASKLGVPSQLKVGH